MSLCAEITVRRADTAFREVFSDVDVLVEFDPFVPTGDHFFPYLWVDGDRDAVGRFEDRITDVAAVASASALQDRGSSRLYWIDWEARPEGVFAAASRSDVSVKRAIGTELGWGLRLQGHDHDCLASFRDECVAQSIRFTLERLHPPRPATTRGGSLTESQRESLKLALEEGYYDVPRGTTLELLGESLGVSRQAVSNRLRRGTKRLVEAILLDPGDRLEDRIDTPTLRAGGEERI